jgi:hypothetical protein
VFAGQAEAVGEFGGLSLFLNRIAEQASGEMTEYQANSIIATRSATPMPSAPPEPPSPVTMLTIGVRRRTFPARLRAIAFGLPAFLGADAGIGAGGVDQGDDREGQTSRPVSCSAGPCDTLRGGQAERTADLFLGIAALVMADEHDFGPPTRASPQ